MDLLTDGGRADRQPDARAALQHRSARRTAVGDRRNGPSRNRRLKHLPIGLFGASTGAAAALVAAANHPALVKSVVSRGGRPDLAGESLAKVKAPTMLIVGGYDDAVLVLNEQAKAKMTGRGGAEDRAARDASVRRARRAGAGRGLCGGVVLGDAEAED